MDLSSQQAVLTFEVPRSYRLHSWSPCGLFICFTARYQNVLEEDFEITDYALCIHDSITGCFSMKVELDCEVQQVQWHPSGCAVLIRHCKGWKIASFLTNAEQFC